MKLEMRNEELIDLMEKLMTLHIRPVMIMIDGKMINVTAYLNWDWMEYAKGDKT